MRIISRSGTRTSGHGPPTPTVSSRTSIPRSRVRRRPAKFTRRSRRPRRTDEASTLRVEHFADGPEQRLGVEWLLEQPLAGANQAFARRDAVAVAGKKQHADSRPALAQRGGELRAARTWHHQIGRNEIDRAGMCARDLDRVDAVARGEHAVSAALEDAARHRPILLLV